MGLSFTPLAFAATAGVDRAEAGLASGLLNTSRQVGGSIALAALATLAAARTAAVLRGDRASVVANRIHQNAALTSGFSRVFLAAAIIALAGLVATLIIPRQPAPPAAVPGSTPQPTR